MYDCSHSGGLRSTAQRRLSRACYAMGTAEVVDNKGDKHLAPLLYYPVHSNHARAPLSLGLVNFLRQSCNCRGGSVRNFPFRTKNKHRPEARRLCVPLGKNDRHFSREAFWLYPLLRNHGLRLMTEDEIALRERIRRSPLNKYVTETSQQCVGGQRDEGQRDNSRAGVAAENQPPENPR
jgi:hypothetical protein